MKRHHSHRVLDYQLGSCVQSKEALTTKELPLAVVEGKATAKHINTTHLQPTERVLLSRTAWISSKKVGEYNPL